MNAEPGYRVVIDQIFGENAMGKKTQSEMQTWQKVDITTTYLFVKQDYSLEWLPADSYVKADVNVVKIDDPAPITHQDEMAVDPFAPEAGGEIVEMPFADYHATHKLGFQKPGLTLPEGRNYALDQEKIDVINQMYGPFLETKQHYLFVDKERIEAAYSTGELSSEVFNAIVQKVGSWTRARSDEHLDWSTLPSQYEQYRIENTLWVDSLDQE